MVKVDILILKNGSARLCTAVLEVLHTADYLLRSNDSSGLTSYLVMSCVSCST